MSLLGLGKFFTNVGNKVATKCYALKFGQQVGKTAKNGNKVFCKTGNGRKVLTGIDKDGRIISQVRKYDSGPNIVNFNGTSHTVMTGETEKTVYNKAGRVIQKRSSDRGVNMYRNTVVNYDGGFYSAPIDFKQTKLYFGDTPRMYVMDSSKLRNFNKVLG